MIVRILVAALLIPLVLYLSYSGGVFLHVFVLLVQTLGAYELTNIFYKQKIFHNKFLLPMAVFITLNLLFLFPELSVIGLFFIYLFGYVSALIVMQVTENRINSISNHVFGFFYLILPGIFWLKLRHISLDFNTGFLLLLITYAGTWVPDSAAYFVGSAIGKHKISPKISPGKSVEGLIGGALFAVIFMAGLFLLINRFFPSSPLPGKLYHYLVYGLLVTVIGFVGDLFESMLKRDVNIKDSSNIIPGHGGILDRLDSFYFNIIFSYYFFAFVM